ncbi:MAG: hypothetical protein NUV72_08685, partial [Bauldia sp.]|nr:hypothetical protein [Bauldia sp.]
MNLKTPTATPRRRKGGFFLPSMRPMSRTLRSWVTADGVFSSDMPTLPQGRKSVILFHRLVMSAQFARRKIKVDDIGSDSRRTGRRADGAVSSAIDIVSRIQRVESELSPAERRVAETV